MQKGVVRFRVPADRVKRLKDKIRKLTSRKWSVAMEYRLHKLAQLMRGWVQYYKMASMLRMTSDMDRWIRRRLRAIRWKEWKRIRTKHDNLVRLGIENSNAWEHANTRKKYWRIAGSWVLTKTLTNQYWSNQGFQDFNSYYLSVKIDVS